MQEQILNQTLSLEAKELLNKDLLRVAFMSKITLNYLAEVLAYDNLQSSLSRDALVSQVGLENLITSIQTVTSAKGNKWLEKELNKEKLYDIATLIELTARVGVEEGEENYEEFQSLIVDLLSAVYYAQQNRKNLHFSKYKALFQIIRNEVLADTNHIPGQVWYRNGELWLRTSQPEQKSNDGNI